MGAREGMSRRREAGAGNFIAGYDAHVGDVYAYLGYRTGSAEDAEDLTQVTFERALVGWAGFDPTRGSVRAWLLGIARNALIDHQRRVARRPDLVPRSEALDARAAVDDAAELGISPELEQALAVLDDRARELIALRYGGDLSGAEIAELTGLSLANVQQILSRSLRRLREEIERLQPAPATARGSAHSPGRLAYNQG